MTTCSTRTPAPTLWVLHVFVSLFTCVQVLEEAAKRIEENTPWYEKIGLKYEESGDIRDVTVAAILAYNVTGGLIDAASETALAPAFVILKELVGAVLNAAAARGEVLELIKYCVGISRCLVDAVKQTHLPSHISMKLGEFRSEMEAIKKFVEEYDAQKGFCRNLILGSRHRSTAANHKSKLEEILEALKVVYIIDNNRGVHEIAEKLKNQEPPILPKHAKIPLAALSLPEAYVKRTAMQEKAVSGLVNKERSSTATVCLWGMGGGGKTVLASSIVRDNRVLSSFSNGIFWFYVGREGKARVALILELLARELAVAHADTPLHSPNVFDSANKAARDVSETIKSKTLRCLVVLDNVWDVEVVDAFADTGIHVLVTTREETVIPPENREVMVEVGDMGQEEGLELLKKTSRTRGPLPPEAKQV